MLRGFLAQWWVNFCLGPTPDYGISCPAWRATGPVLEHGSSRLNWAQTISNDLYWGEQIQSKGRHASYPIIPVHVCVMRGTTGEGLGPFYMCPAETPTPGNGIPVTGAISDLLSFFVIWLKYFVGFLAGSRLLHSSGMPSPAGSCIIHTPRVGG